MRHPVPLLAVIAAAPFAHALDTAPWKFSQTVSATPGALTALDLPDATLDAARFDLADLRLTDASGIEIPYVVDTAHLTGALTGAKSRPAKTFVTRLEGNSTVILLETGLTDPVNGVDLITPAPAFLKPVRVEGSDDGANWTTLAEGLPIFCQKNGAENLRVNFPAGIRKHLRITVDDAKDDPVPFTGATVHGTEVTLRSARDERVAVPAKILSRVEKTGVTELRVDLGAANLPLAGITLDTPEALFTRRVTVSLELPGDDPPMRMELARGSLWNITGLGETSSQKRLAVERSVPTREIIVSIRNGDSPPLAITGISVDRRPRRLIFVAPPGPVTLRSGHPAVAAPRYDLDLLAAKIKTAETTPATAGDLTPNPGYKPHVAPPAPVLAGAPLDTDDWGARKPVALAAPGAQRLELDAGTLAFARADLGDLRLMRDGRQIPYLVEKSSATRTLPLVAQPDSASGKSGVTRLRIAMPAGALPATELFCRPETAVFRRSVRLLREVSDARDGRREIELAAAMWTRDSVDTDTLRLSLDGTPLPGPVILEIEDAGGAPLELAEFGIRYPVTRLRFATTDTSPVFLYYDNPDAAAPHYADLGPVVGKLLAAPATDATPGAEERLLAVSGSATKRYSGPILWTALAGLVAGLLFIVAKMLPKPGSR